MRPCTGCGQLTDRVEGTVRASGGSLFKSYRTKGVPFCLKCRQEYDANTEAARQAESDKLAALRARREEKRRLGIPLTDEDYS